MGGRRYLRLRVVTAVAYARRVSTPAESSGGTGLFIAFEGGDGAGKSTQVGELARWCESLGRVVLITREPGGGALGTGIRDLLLHAGEVCPRAEALLFAADRADHVDTVIRPALGRGEVVITDRYRDSSIAYQGSGRHLGIRDVRQLSAWATDGLLPDLTIVLDVPPATGASRRTGKADRMESEGADFHGRVRKAFLDLAEAEPTRYLVLDATLPRADLAERIRKQVEWLLTVEDLPLEPWGTP